MYCHILVTRDLFVTRVCITWTDINIKIGEAYIEHPTTFKPCPSYFLKIIIWPDREAEIIHYNIRELFSDFNFQSLLKDTFIISIINHLCGQTAAGYKCTINHTFCPVNCNSNNLLIIKLSWLCGIEFSGDCRTHTQYTTLGLLGYNSGWSSSLHRWIWFYHIRNSYFGWGIHQSLQ